MSWLREAVTSPNTGHVSSSRVVALVAGLTLSAATIWLSLAAFWEVELVPALTVFGGALAGLAGANYVANRMSNKGEEK